VAYTLAEGLSLAGVVLVPATLLLVVLGTPIAVLVLAHGRTTIDGAQLTGHTLVAFAIGLLPFSAFQMQLRAWLALHNSRTPMLVNLWITALNLFLDVVLYVALPGTDKVVGLAIGYTASYFLGTVIFASKLRRRIVATRPTHVIRTHVRLLVAATLAGFPTYLIGQLIQDAAGSGPLGALATIVVAAPVGMFCFLVLIRRMRVNELDRLLTMLPGGRRLRV
jgi:putative peptidoglycan lipid II flippase